jgi:acetate kinase
MLSWLQCVVVRLWAISKPSDLNAIRHWVVHGGAAPVNTVLTNESIINSICASCDLAPLHNPYNLAGIELMRGLLPSILQVAVFDTAFHQMMPIHAYI